MGYSDYDLERPLIAVANSHNRLVPGHFNLFDERASDATSTTEALGMYKAGKIDEETYLRRQLCSTAAAWR